jgi:hypothetical protein
MNSPLGDALIGGATWLLVMVIYATLRALGFKLSVNDFEHYAGLSVGLILGGFIFYVILGDVLGLASGVWLGPSAPHLGELATNAGLLD